MKCKHPELRNGELFLANITNLKQLSQYPYKTYRIGNHSFNIFNDKMPPKSETLFPVFVSESEYKSLHKKD